MAAERARTGSARQVAAFFLLLGCVVGGQQLVVHQIRGEVVTNRTVGVKITEQLEGLKAGQADRWTKTDHLQFAEKLREMNPGLKVP